MELHSFGVFCSPVSIMHWKEPQAKKEQVLIFLMTSVKVG